MSIHRDVCGVKTVPLEQGVNTVTDLLYFAS